jgi:hypothetical protein
LTFASNSEIYRLEKDYFSIWLSILKLFFSDDVSLVA